MSDFDKRAKQVEKEAKPDFSRLSWEEEDALVRLRAETALSIMQATMKSIGYVDKEKKPVDLDKTEQEYSKSKSLRNKLLLSNVAVFVLGAAIPPVGMLLYATVIMGVAAEIAFKIKKRKYLNAIKAPDGQDSKNEDKNAEVKALFNGMKDAYARGQFGFVNALSELDSNPESLKKEFKEKIGLAEQQAKNGFMERKIKAYSKVSDDDVIAGKEASEANVESVAVSSQQSARKARPIG